MLQDCEPIFVYADMQNVCRCMQICMNTFPGSAPFESPKFYTKSCGNRGFQLLMDLWGGGGGGGGTCAPTSTVDEDFLDIMWVFSSCGWAPPIENQGSTKNDQLCPKNDSIKVGPVY